MAEQESEYVKLISSDGFEFIIHREAAMRSGTMKNMLSGAGTEFYTVLLSVLNFANMSLIANFTESLENQVTFRDIKYVSLLCFNA
jgi:transcription elongation factor B subunit 1